jgi:hypothetical protein
MDTGTARQPTGINSEFINAIEHGRAEIPADLERRLLKELG